MKKIAIATVLGIIIGLGISFYGIPAVGDNLGYYYNAPTSITLTATTTADNAIAFDVRGKKDFTISISDNETSTGTIKFVGSINNLPPNPIGTASSTNEWSYVQLVSLKDGTNVNGETGVVSTSTTETVQKYKLYGTNLAYLTPVLTSKIDAVEFVITLMSDEGNN